jgi:Zn-dependent M28 family amino/carboxypeptidase
MRTARSVLWATVVTAFACGAPAAAAKPPDINANRLEHRVTVEGVLEHQKALQEIADDNDGTRYTRTSGYTASAAYVLATLKAAGYDNAHYEMFNMPIWNETQPPVLARVTPTAKTYVPGTADDDGEAGVDFITFEHSPTAAVTAPVVPVSNIVIPSPGGTASGCEAGDYPAAIDGAIALIQRGTCAFTQKLALAAEAGAVGVILFNEGDTAGRTAALFRSADPGYEIPAVLASFAVGKELYDLYKAGQAPTVNLQTFGVETPTFYPNVVADTPRGDRDHMVFAGAHLDSVPAGPGINDDGSGTAFQLELAEQLARPGTPPRNMVRFLWFGGEEDGLVGSQYYAAHMSADEVARTDVMIDTDMIASPNFARLVYDGNHDETEEGTAGPPGSEVIEEVFERYWAQQGLASENIPFDGRSDYVGFVNRGIPSGGVFAGAEAPKTAAQVALYGGVQGEQLDPCYHEDCDTYDTVTGQPPAETMNVFEAAPTPANLVIAQAQADSLNGNAIRSLEQFLPNLTHAVWYFARAKDAIPDETATSTKGKKAKAARAMKSAKRGYRFKYMGHRRARVR